MPNVISIDRRIAAPSAPDRESRLLAIRQEGALLLNLYQSISDEEVRAGILALVKSMRPIWVRPDPLLDCFEPNAAADACRD